MNVEELIQHGFYAIENKNLLLQAYEEVFNKKLCKTCTGSYITAYNALNAYVMSSKKTTKNKPEFTIKQQHINDTMCINGGVIQLSTITQDQIKAYIIPYKSNHHLINEKA